MRIDNPSISGSISFIAGTNSLSGTNVSLTGSFSGSFTGDGSLLSGVTSYTDNDTLAYINSIGVISGSAQIASDISGSFTSTSQSIASDIADIIDGTTVITSASYALTASHAENFTATSISTEYFDFNTNPTAEPVEGRLVWNATDGTLDLGLGNATLQIGQEQYWYVRNNTASPIPNGAAVMATGTLGASGRITAAPMVADGTIPAKFFLGIATQEIPVDADGYVTTFGKVRGFDTSLIPSGSVLYVSPSTPGGLTITEPTAPNLKLPVAFAVSQANNGTLAVRTTTGTRLANAHDVQITSPAYGELLMRSGSIWINTSQLTGSYSIEGSLTATSITGSLLATNGILSSSIQIASDISGSFTSLSQSIAENINTKLNIADTGSFAKTNINNVFSGTQTFTNLTVSGTGSFAYINSITGSAKIIGDSFIVVNNNTPAERYGGLSVYDSGSAGTTVSLFFDGELNDWNYEYTSPGGTDYGTVLFGPEYSTKGSPTYPTNTRLQKGSGTHHLADSNISDNGSKVSINSNTEVTGSLVVSSTITGTLSGNASTATTASFASTAPYSGLQGTVPTWNQNTTGTAATASHVLASNVNGQVASARNADTASYISSANIDGNITASAIAASNITGTIDISSQTNLAGGTNLTLSGDTLNLDAAISLTSVTASFKGDVDGNAKTATNVAYSGLTGTVPTWNQNTTGTAATASHVLGANVNGQVASARNADTASYISSANIDGNITASAVTWANITSKPAGIISGSAQITQLANTASAGQFATTGNVTIGGNLTVNGVTTTLNTTNLDVEDRFIFLNSGSGSAAPASEGGIIVEGATAGVGEAFFYDGVSTRRWAVASGIAKTATGADPDAFVATVFNGTQDEMNSAGYAKLGNILIDGSGDIFMVTAE